MNTKEWAIVIVVMIVIAIAASLITSNLTGNVVGVRSGNNYKVYTATEIDNLFAADTYSNLSKNIKANSCDADGQCETKSLIADAGSRIGSVVIEGKTISTKGGSTSALVLTSDIKSVVVDSSLSANRGINLNPSVGSPNCDITQRGLLYFAPALIYVNITTNSSTNLPDVLRICAKASDGKFYWRQVTLS